MIIIFLGPPGAGKGTQAKLLGQKLNIPVISIGQLLREAYRKGIPEGHQWWEIYGRRGLNAPMRLKSKILTEALTQAKTGFILEGFPKTQEDLDALQKYLQDKDQKIDRVFHLTVSDQVSLERILARKTKGELEGRVRDDDKAEILKIRINQGYRQDLPLILDHFRRLGVLEEVLGEQEEEIVHREILTRLELKND